MHTPGILPATCTDSPPHLRTEDDTHSWGFTCTDSPPENRRRYINTPGPSVFTVEVDSLLRDESVSASHFIEDVGHPVFDAAVSCDVVPVVHDLALARTHRHRHHLVVCALLELEIGDVVEHLRQKNITTTIEK